MPLSEQQIAEGWIEHDGGPCPVPRNQSVSILTRRGREWKSLPASRWDWWHSNHPADIMAFKPEPSHD